MNTRDERRARVRRLTNDRNARIEGFAPVGASDGVRQYRRAPKAKRALLTRYEARMPAPIGVKV